MDHEIPCGASAAERIHNRRVELQAAHVMTTAAARKHFIDARAEEMISGLREFAQLVAEIEESSMAEMMMIALRDAVAESGEVWDGITAFRRILEVVAKAKAAAEWEGIAPLADDSGDAADRAYEAAQYARLYGEGW